ncbi:hypothetical protein [Mycobacterium sp. PSTR-4-N]|uniref:hypothetical protein n=1 Tax=Mycobacterium sp. PSTR-4-N TaxID=2917745 RepID=UPI001F14DF2D|nr:hypothetical protein [Mycobacterium sp. PSTR-4-N]MCG7592450.1 hypothetical protein [Mycobacterium sp. PSTR-4-N]
MRGQLTLLVSVLAALGVAACANGSTETKVSTTTVTRFVPTPDAEGAAPTAASSDVPAPIAPAGSVMSTDGMYVVGSDVAPGTYKSAPTMENGYPFCTWKRLSDFSGSDESVIAIDNQPGQTFVTIAPTDLAFETQSCQPWVRVG